MNKAGVIVDVIFGYDDLRAQNAALSAQVATLTAENVRLTKALARATETANFYYGLHADKQLRIAEDAWGLPGGS